jgi:putative transposase
LWRSLKYELIYLKAFENGIQLKQEVNEWFEWYNERRLHQSLDYKTPNQVYGQVNQDNDAVENRKVMVKIQRF